MRRIARMASLVALLLAASFVPAQEAKSDKDRVQGAWAVAALVVGGRPAPAEEFQGMRFLFEGDKLTFVPPGREDGGTVARRSFRVALDPTRKPAAVDVVALDGDYKGTASPGIYELRGDELRWCLSDDPENKTRPTEFASPEGTRLYLFTLKRVK
jgi:uncharacterized protein (TIGR03067 family)